MVEVEYQDRLAILRLNRPPVNAVDVDLLRAVDLALGEIAGRDDLAALVVTGAGRAFSAGLDLRDVPSYTPAGQREMVRGINRMVATLYGLPIPTVAAVTGHAIAGGLVIALACDYRIGTSAPCRIGLTEARAGIPFPHAAMAIVKAELGPAVARRRTLVAMNGSSQEALAEGILDEVQAPEAVVPRALEVARDLATIPRVAYGRIKRQLRAETLARIEPGAADGTDPLLDDWLGPDTREAAAALLRK
jgi:enoyl-CoA hydratase